MNKLDVPISERDHIEGSLKASIQLVEYGDYECPHCKAAFPIVKRIQAEFGEGLCFAYRHFPLMEIHPHAQAAAEAAEAAGAQGQFWKMHEALFLNSPILDMPHLLIYAGVVGLDVRRLRRDLTGHSYLPRIREDLESGVRSGVRGTPTFFMNGTRYEGRYDLESMLTALTAVHEATRER